MVTGSRDLDEPAAVRSFLNEFCPDIVMHGGCPTGADMDAQNWAEEHTTLVLSFPAEWRKYGRDAGPRRNRDMCKAAALLRRYHHSVIVGAFPRGEAHGTRNCMAAAARQGLYVEVL